MAMRFVENISPLNLLKDEYMNQFSVPMKVDLNDDFFVLTGTLWGEIRGGSKEAKQNVGQVIKNRYVALKAHHPHATWREICLAPLQFSCWNADDVNRSKIVATNNHFRTPSWKECAEVAWELMHGTNPDRVKGAKNYYANSALQPPKWAEKPAVITLDDGFNHYVYIPE